MKWMEVVMVAVVVDDEFEVLLESVVDVVFGEKKWVRCDDDELDVYEVYMGEWKWEKKKKKGKKVKRRAYERDGFEVVALDVEDDDGGGGGLKMVSEFVCVRLMEKYVWLGEML